MVISERSIDIFTLVSFLCFAVSRPRRDLTAAVSLSALARPTLINRARARARLSCSRVAQYPLSDSQCVILNISYVPLCARTHALSRTHV